MRPPEAALVTLEDAREVVRIQRERIESLTEGRDRAILERRQAFAVLGALVSRDPSMEEPGAPVLAVDGVCCALCLAALDTEAEESGAYQGRVAEHLDDCPWRLAAELVGAVPA